MIKHLKKISTPKMLVAVVSGVVLTATLSLAFANTNNNTIEVDASQKITHFTYNSDVQDGYLISPLGGNPNGPDYDNKWSIDSQTQAIYFSNAEQNSYVAQGANTSISAGNIETTEKISIPAQTSKSKTYLSIKHKFEVEALADYDILSIDLIGESVDSPNSLNKVDIDLKDVDSGVLYDIKSSQNGTQLATFDGVSVFDITKMQGLDTTLSFNFDTVDGLYNNYEGWEISEIELYTLIADEFDEIEKPKNENITYSQSIIYPEVYNGENGLWQLVYGEGPDCLNATEPNEPICDVEPPVIGFKYQNSIGSYETGVNSGNLTDDSLTKNSGFVVTESLQLPSEGQTKLSFKQLLDVESYPDYDKYSINVQCVSCSPDEQLEYILMQKDGTVKDSYNIEVWDKIALDIPQELNGESVRFNFDFDTIDEKYNDYKGWEIRNLELVQYGNQMEVCLPDNIDCMDECLPGDIECENIMPLPCYPMSDPECSPSNEEPYAYISLVSSVEPNYGIGFESIEDKNGNSLPNLWKEFVNSGCTEGTELEPGLCWDGIPYFKYGFESIDNTGNIFEENYDNGTRNGGILTTDYFTIPESEVLKEVWFDIDQSVSLEKNPSYDKAEIVLEAIEELIISCNTSQGFPVDEEGNPLDNEPTSCDEYPASEPAQVTIWNKNQENISSIDISSYLLELESMVSDPKTMSYRILFKFDTVDKYANGTNPDGTNNEDINGWSIYEAGIRFRFVEGETIANPVGDIYETSIVLGPNPYSSSPDQPEELVFNFAYAPENDEIAYSGEYAGNNGCDRIDDIVFDFVDGVVKVEAYKFSNPGEICTQAIEIFGISGSDTIVLSDAQKDKIKEEGLTVEMEIKSETIPEDCAPEAPGDCGTGISDPLDFSIQSGETSASAENLSLSFNYQKPAYETSFEINYVGDYMYTNGCDALDYIDFVFENETETIVAKAYREPFDPNVACTMALGVEDVSGKGMITLTEEQNQILKDSGFKIELQVFDGISNFDPGEIIPEQPVSFDVGYLGDYSPCILKNTSFQTGEFTSDTPLTYALEQGAQNGIVSSDGDGVFTYSPNSNFTGFDTFRVSATSEVYSNSMAVIDTTVEVVDDLNNCGAPVGVG